MPRDPLPKAFPWSPLLSSSSPQQRVRLKGVTVIHSRGLSPQDPQPQPFSLRPVTQRWPRTPTSPSSRHSHILSRKRARGDCQGARHFSGEDLKAEALAPDPQNFWTGKPEGAGLLPSQLPLPISAVPAPILVLVPPPHLSCASPHENKTVRQMDIF